MIFERRKSQSQLSFLVHTSMGPLFARKGFEMTIYQSSGTSIKFTNVIMIFIITATLFFVFGCNNDLEHANFSDNTSNTHGQR